MIGLLGMVSRVSVVFATVSPVLCKGGPRRLD